MKIGLSRTWHHIQKKLNKTNGLQRGPQLTQAHIAGTILQDGLEEQVHRKHQIKMKLVRMKKTKTIDLDGDEFVSELSE